MGGNATDVWEDRMEGGREGGGGGGGGEGILLLHINGCRSNSQGF